MKAIKSLIIPLAYATLPGLTGLAALACSGNVDSGNGAGVTGPSPGEALPAAGAQDPTADPAVTDPNASAEPNPVADIELGTGIVRRLTPTEYNNTVRDLLGTTLRPAELFPADPGAHGFENASAAQAISPSHLELYERASEELVQAAFADPAQLGNIVNCDLALGETCIRQSLEAFLPRAWRRPVQPAEVDLLMSLAAVEAQRGGTPEEQMKLVVRGALTSPNFMFLIERDPDPASPVPHRLNDYELASRLSYFLWSSMPDQALFAQAAAGSLQDDTVLASEVTRMLADPKAASLLDVFAAQWLQLDKVKKHSPDAELYPGVGDDVKTAMVTESKQFFASLLHNGGTVGQLLGADYTFVDAALAEHYELPAPTTPFTQVSLQGSNRIGGLLGQASILMHTSSPLMTSPVKRGAWVLDNILCTPPPDPPPDVMAELPELMEGENLTVRERLEQHRANPTCAACHALIDPVGLGLENFDAVGRYRTTDSGKPIDASGQLPGGAAFNDAVELQALLAADERLSACVGKKLFTYALARSPQPPDTEHLNAVAPSNDTPLLSVLTNLVSSEAFRSRRAPLEEVAQ